MKNKTQYVQGKMAASLKCFEDQNYLTLCLIQPLNGGRGVGGGNRQQELVFINQKDG